MKKHLINTTLIYLFLIIFFDNLAYSSTSLSFNQCIEQSYLHNSEILAAMANLENSESKVLVTRASFLPTLKANLNYDHTNYSTYTTSLIASHNLFSGMSDWNKYQLAQTQNEASQLSFLSTLSKVSFDLKKAYASLFYAQNLIVLLEDVVKRRNENLKLVELRFSSGRENKGSLLLSKAYLAQSELELMQAKNALSYYGQDLNRVLGFNEPQDITLKDDLTTPNISSKKLLLSAHQTLTFKLANKNFEAANFELKESRSGFFPSLSITGTQSKSSREFNQGNTERSLGINLSIPLFNGGADFYQIQSATANLKNKYEIKENTLREVSTQIDQAHSLALESQKKIEVNSLFVEASKVRSKIAKEQYNNGLISFSDWDLVENEYINYQKNLLLSKKDAAINFANLENIKGEGVYHE
jgi:outer membrane protein TolC